jgi:hypothetical protein
MREGQAAALHIDSRATIDTGDWLIAESLCDEGIPGDCRAVPRPPVNNATAKELPDFGRPRKRCDKAGRPDDLILAKRETRRLRGVAGPAR